MIVSSSSSRSMALCWRGGGGLLTPSSSPAFYKHFLFIRHSCFSLSSFLFLSFFNFEPFLSTFMSDSAHFLPLFCLAFPPFSSAFPSSSSRNLRQLSSIIRWTGQRYSSTPPPSPDPTLHPSMSFSSSSFLSSVLHILF